MPNKPLSTLLLGIACCAQLHVLAQERSIDLPDPALAPRPKIIVLSGIAGEGSSGVFQTFFLSAERPIGAYQNLGLQYTSYLSKTGDPYYSYSNLRAGSYEVGVVSKFFLHGRLSGRRSHLYYGPQVRFGSRKMVYVYPYSNAGIGPYDYRVQTTKILFCLGGQYRLGHAVFEWSLPFGAEYTRSNLPTEFDPYGYYGTGEDGRHFAIMPSVGIGFRL